ncbi:MAG: conjugative transfer signal peptidase TraF [Acidobacteriota bacterium]|nr:conjugative transfer signal peptidase TraF [Acidobacteriota bacterium]
MTGNATARRSLVAGGILVAAAALAGSGLRWNGSGSLPRGLYLVRTAGRQPAPMALVLVCPPQGAGELAAERGYLPRGSCPGGPQPLGKLLLAGAGDRIDLAPDGLSVNGTPVPGSRLQRTDAAGRPLPHVPYGTYLLRHGQIWTFSPHPRSFDSRYFGPVTDLRGSLVPLLVTPDVAIEAFVDTWRRRSAARRTTLL